MKHFTPEEVAKINKQSKYNQEHCPRCPEGKNLNTRTNPNGSKHCNRCGYNWITST